LHYCYNLNSLQQHERMMLSVFHSKNTSVVVQTYTRRGRINLVERERDVFVAG
jgi:hypothetical protein